MNLKCRRCHKREAQTGKRICAHCAKRPKARRSSHSSSFRSRGGAAGVLERATLAASFPVANGSYYTDRHGDQADSHAGEG
ncbi:MAG: hypothetical protein IT318_24910 [Anaerolineales bacterium]|nr:hypothetical protein [Anaerolineales bacterium]